MSDNDVEMSDRPISRLTELTEEMTLVLQRPENDGVRAIVFLDTDENGGIQLYGWEDATEAMACLFVHMQAIFKAQGKQLDFIGVPDSPEGL